MPTRRVRSHVRNGRRVSGYSQGYTKGDARTAAAGAGVDLLLTLGAVFQVITATMALVTAILVSLAAIVGGTSRGRHTTGTAVRKTRATYRRRRRARRPPARTRSTRSSAPWVNDRTGIWRRIDGKWMKVSP